jgi:hypothetical protein
MKFSAPTPIDMGRTTIALVDIRESEITLGQSAP